MYAFKIEVEARKPTVVWTASPPEGVVVTSIIFGDGVVIVYGLGERDTLADWANPMPDGIEFEMWSI